MTAYEHPTLTELGYPIDLHSTMYAIRRKQPEDITYMLMSMMEDQGDPPTHAVRLSWNRDHFLLPTNKKMEVYGSAGNIPIFVEMVGENTALVKYGKDIILLSWNIDNEQHWFMIPPGPESLRENANLLLVEVAHDEEDKLRQLLEEVDKLRRLADWVERIPISPAVGPDAEVTPK